MFLGDFDLKAYLADLVLLMLLLCLVLSVPPCTEPVEGSPALRLLILYCDYRPMLFEYSILNDLPCPPLFADDTT